MPFQYLSWNLADPCESFALTDLGDEKLRDGEFIDAIAALDKAVESEPRWPVVWLHRANAKLKIADYEGSILDASKVIEMQDQITKAYEVRGEARFLHGDLKGAISDLSMVISREPENAYALWKRSRVRYALGLLDECLEDSKAVTCMENCELGASAVADSWLITALAQTCLATSPSAVSKACTRALLLNPNMPEAYFTRAQAQLNMGFISACVADCSDSLRLDSGTALAYATRGRAWLIQKNWKKSGRGLSSSS